MHWDRSAFISTGNFAQIRLGIVTQFDDVRGSQKPEELQRSYPRRKLFCGVEAGCGLRGISSCGISRANQIDWHFLFAAMVAEL